MQKWNLPEILFTSSSVSLQHKLSLLPFSVRDRTTLAYTLRSISSSALILTLVNIVFLWLRTVSHGFKRTRLDLNHNPRSFNSILHKIVLPWTMHVHSDVTVAADIPFKEVTGRKDVQNGGRSILKMTTSFGLFPSLSKVKIHFFLLFTSNLSYVNSFKLPYEIKLLAFRSPLNWIGCSCRGTIGW